MSPVTVVADNVGAHLRTLVADRAAAGVRLDRLLQAKLPEISRTRLQALIRAGHVREDGTAIGEPGHKVKPGATYQVQVPPPEAAVPLPQSIALNIVFEDTSLLVLDKPAGLVVHPSAGHADGTLVNALIAHCGDSLAGIGGVRRPGIVHRLDKGTSGLLVIAKTDAAHKLLCEQFAAHGADGRMRRAYLAIVWGEPKPRSGRIATSIGRKATNRTKMAVVRTGQGRAAATNYEVLETVISADGRPLASLVRCVLETGRTHQIRVHLAHIGHPLFGDATYGTGFATSAARLGKPALAALQALDRQALHATLLGFAHPRTGKALQFESPLPFDISALWDALRGV